MPSPQEALFPETRVGGYSRVDSTVDFYTRVSALLSPQSVLLDFGAGRGSSFDEEESFRRNLQSFKGKVQRVIGADVDPAVKTNPGLDQAVVITPEGRIELPDQSVDIIVSDWTFEHLFDPAGSVSELQRLLRPGGWICARTPNKSGYISLANRVIPNAMHARVLSRIQPDRQTRDVFPAAYRLNTRNDFDRYFPPPSFTTYAYTVNPEPAYFGNSIAAWRLMYGLGRLLPERLGSTWHIFVQSTAA